MMGKYSTDQSDALLVCLHMNFDNHGETRIAMLDSGCNNIMLPLDDEVRDKAIDFDRNGGITGEGVQQSFTADASGTLGISIPGTAPDGSLFQITKEIWPSIAGMTFGSSNTQCFPQHAMTLLPQSQCLPQFQSEALPPEHILLRDMPQGGESMVGKHRKGMVQIFSQSCIVHALSAPNLKLSPLRCENLRETAIQCLKLRENI